MRNYTYPSPPAWQPPKDPYRHIAEELARQLLWLATSPTRRRFLVQWVRKHLMAMREAIEATSVSEGPTEAAKAGSLREVMRRYMVQVYDDCDGNTTAAAAHLGVTPKTLRSWLRQEKKQKKDS